MALINRIATESVLIEVLQERDRQDTKWGQQNHPDTPNVDTAQLKATMYRDSCQEAAAQGCVTWEHILLEEVYEALSEKDPRKLRAELLQTAAVLVAWVEDIDRRST